MTRVREQLLIREREAALRPAQDQTNPADALDPRIEQIREQQSPVAEAPTGFSVEDLPAWQQDRDDGLSL